MELQLIIQIFNKNNHRNRNDWQITSNNLIESNGETYEDTIYFTQFESEWIAKGYINKLLKEKIKIELLNKEFTEILNNDFWDMYEPF